MNADRSAPSSRAAGAAGHRVRVDLRGRTALVTGGTGGMGRVVVTELARAGAHVLTVSRDASRGRHLREQIAREVGADRVQVLTGDLSVRADLHALAERVKAEHPELHLLVNNAGAHYRTRGLSADGVERHVAVNHLAGFTLTYLLQDQLRAAAAAGTGPAHGVAAGGVGARVVDVVSDTVNDTRTLKLGGSPRPVRLDPAQLVDLRRINPAEGFVAFEAYARAKLLTTMCALEFAHRLAADGVAVNCVHPGIVSTGIVDDLVPTWLRPLRPLLHRVLLTPEQGAASTLRLATDPEVTGTGLYCRRSTPAPAPAAVHDPRLRAAAWALSRDWAETP
ncbi:SDR family NAD(P)-dependent oxidoreductase [Kineococcus gypseus]|uniref:SDR family NAD(P)-dependent oxidoreductase n=1 Tax=Kineococcus gypseus TaxID=1637102 RepID=UPI003D7CC2FF